MSDAALQASCEIALDRPLLLLVRNKHVLLKIPNVDLLNVSSDVVGLNIVFPGSDT